MRHRLVPILVVVALESACTRGRTGSGDGAIDVATDSTQVAAIVPDFMRFLNAGAFDSLGALLRDDFEILETGLRGTATEFVDGLRGLQLLDGTLRQVNLRTRVVGDLAYQTFDALGGYTSGGQQFTVTERESIVFRKTDGRWKIVLWHATPRSDSATVGANSADETEIRRLEDNRCRGSKRRTRRS